MNQILQTRLISNNKKKIKKKILKIQFSISLLLFFVIGFYLGLLNYKRYQNEKYSSDILENYNITKLYANSSKSSNKSNTYNVIGIISIPSLGIEYPIFSSCNEELLKISPCRFYGCLPGKSGNLCIAGHNYNNNKFFSKIGFLKNNDAIYIYDSFNKCFDYRVFSNYEVKSDNLSPIYSNSINSKEITLITCNNLNNNRIIIKAKIIT